MWVFLEKRVFKVAEYSRFKWIVYLRFQNQNAMYGNLSCILNVLRKIRTCFPYTAAKLIKIIAVLANILRKSNPTN
jgi:hypothetical protein